jgi:hypothetical protein
MTFRLTPALQQSDTIELLETRLLISDTKVSLGGKR